MGSIDHTRWGPGHALVTGVCHDRSVSPIHALARTPLRCGGFAPEMRKCAMPATARWLDRHAPTRATRPMTLARHKSGATSRAAIALVCSDMITSRLRR